MVFDNDLCSYLTEQKIIYPRQFGFQTGHPTEHAITNLTDQIHESFEKDCYTFGIFFNLSKALDNVDHEVLLKKLKMCGRGTSHA